MNLKKVVASNVSRVGGVDSLKLESRPRPRLSIFLKCLVMSIKDNDKPLMACI